MEEPKPTWRFAPEFWFANTAELLERAAYYGTLISLVHFLTKVVGLKDHEAGWIGGAFAALIYFFPFFSGAVADRIGFRKGLMLAFFLLSLGYSLLGAFHETGPVLLALFLIVVGGSFVKPIISGTVAKSSDSVNRARAYSIFYMVVNIGSFTGKTLVKEVRQGIGLEMVPYFSSICAFVALVMVTIFYRPSPSPERRGPGFEKVKEIFLDMLEAMKNRRFFWLIIITAGFWTIQGQLYASMPKYVFRVVGENAAPEWYANINPLVVLILVVPITQLIKRWPSEVSISVAMFFLPVISLCMASSVFFNSPVEILGIAIHPVTMAMIMGISLMGVAECFLSPKYLEFASKQAPKGKEGVFLGFAHMNTFFAWLFAFVFSGYLLEIYCPDPGSLSEAGRYSWKLWLEGEGPVPREYARAHYIWYAYAIIGLVSFVAILAFVAFSGRKEMPRDRHE